MSPLAETAAPASTHLTASTPPPECVCAPIMRAQQGAWESRTHSSIRDGGTEASTPQQAEPVVQSSRPKRAHRRGNHHRSTRRTPPAPNRDGQETFACSPLSPNEENHQTFSRFLFETSESGDVVDAAPCSAH